jgi:hypothetical protein
MTNNNLKTKLAIALLAIAVILIGVTISRPSKAVTAQLTGSCGGAINFGRKGKTWSDGKFVNSLLLINFDNNTLQISGTSFDSTMPKGYASQPVFTVNFSLSNGPVTGSHTLSDTASPNQISDFHLLPVNDGKSILIQVKDDDVVGVCQRL